MGLGGRGGGSRGGISIVSESPAEPYALLQSINQSTNQSLTLACLSWKITSHPSHPPRRLLIQNLMPLPPFPPNLNLHTLQHPPPQPLIRDLRPHKRPIRRMKRKPADRLPYLHNLIRRQGDTVGNTPLKDEARLAAGPRAGRVSRGHRDDGVSDEELGVPVQDEGAGEMAAGLDGGDAVEDRGRGAGGTLDEGECLRGGRGAAKPGLVVGGDVDGAGEGGAPGGVGGVVVGVGDDDCFEPAEGVDEVRGGWVEQGDAVPEDVAVGGLQQDGPLADGEFGFCVDGPDGRVVGAAMPFVFVGGLELGEGGPGLAGWGDELAGVVADFAVGWVGGGWVGVVLAAACCADGEVHFRWSGGRLEFLFFFHYFLRVRSNESSEKMAEA